MSRSGKYRRRIKIEKPNPIQERNATGDLVESWLTVAANVPAAVVVASASETVTGNKITAPHVFEFRFRAIKGIDATCRITDDQCKVMGVLTVDDTDPRETVVTAQRES